MLAKCSKSRSCPFYEGGKSLKAYDALMAQIEKKPLPILRLAGRRKVGPGLTFAAVRGSLYNPASYRSLELALARAKAGDGRLLVLLSDPFRGRKPNGAYSNQNDAYYSNTCLDFPVSTDVADYKALAETLRKVAVIASRQSVSILTLRTPCLMPRTISSTGTPQVCGISPPN